MNFLNVETHDLMLWSVGLMLWPVGIDHRFLNVWWGGNEVFCFGAADPRFNHLVGLGIKYFSFVVCLLYCWLTPDLTVWWGGNKEYLLCCLLCYYSKDVPRPGGVL